jgi:serine/threonine-protein kinase
MSSWVGRTFCDRYKILAELAQGSMGQIYLAQDRDRGCIVALKSMAQLDDERLRERFRREAHALALLRHPHIVQLYDFEAQTHVYALGVVFYELIVGQLPFPAQSLVPLVRQITEDEPTPPRQLNPRILPALAGP